MKPFEQARRRAMGWRIVAGADDAQDATDEVDRRLAADIGKCAAIETERSERAKRELPTRLQAGQSRGEPLVGRIARRGMTGNRLEDGGPVETPLGKDMAQAGTVEAGIAIARIVDGVEAAHGSLQRRAGDIEKGAQQDEPRRQGALSPHSGKTAIAGLPGGGQKMRLDLVVLVMAGHDRRGTHFPRGLGKKRISSRARPALEISPRIGTGPAANEVGETEVGRGLSDGQGFRRRFWAKGVIDRDDVEGEIGSAGAEGRGCPHQRQRVRPAGNGKNDPLRSRAQKRQTSPQRAVEAGGGGAKRQQLLAAASACSFFFTLALICG
ncbi:hypothetical protein [Aureimonas sp. SA4125]|uniref:hypothetical protein n=1 Tax=Aureimonas sp. SA4125 TaxID=2826993 RepID=UPI001E5A5CC2|nr:hypothetical protein [Aureimonas sp. SA4125]